MNKRGPIIIIEDDIEDQHVLEDAFKDLGCTNQVIFFNDGQKALDFLDSGTEPFIIFSDINMPRIDGMQLREQVHENEDLRIKSIPYLFFTTTAEQSFVIGAYSKSVQGFFVKPNDYTELKETLKSIMDYWHRCVSPDYVK